jgi:hypothetical protein
MQYVADCAEPSERKTEHILTAVYDVEWLQARNGVCLHKAEHTLLITAKEDDAHGVGLHSIPWFHLTIPGIKHDGGWVTVSNFLFMGWDYVSELLPRTDILFIPQMIYAYGERRWNDVLTGENRRPRRKTCPSVTLYNRNPTWIDPGANPRLRSKRPALTAWAMSRPTVSHTGRDTRLWCWSITLEFRCHAYTYEKC